MAIKRSILKEGDTLGVVALSSACEHGRFESGLKFIELLGFKTKVMLDPVRAYGTKEYLFSSDTARNRAQALEALYRDKRVKAIIAARGAYGAMEVLPIFKFAAAKKNPKPLIGFSDTTALLVGLRQEAGCLTIHGPSVESFSNALERDEKRASAEELMSALCDPNWNPVAKWKLERIFGKGGAKGEILGGNLSLLAAMCGTPWRPKLNGKILFLEDVGEKPYRLHRMLLQLKLSGALAGLRGVLLGSFRNCEHPDQNTPTSFEALADILSNLKVPVWRGVPAGHQGYNLPVPFGINVELA